jgi:uncharacterized protein
MSVFRVAERGIANRVLWVMAALVSVPVFAFAQAEGPEYFRVIELKKEDSVKLRVKPNADAKVVGRIPKSTDGVKNHGCKAGLSPKQWEKASAARKKEDQRTSWCEVEFKDAKGWVMRRFLADGSGQKGEPLESTQPAEQQQASPPPKIDPSFDCEKAEKNAEKLICGDNGLSQLDSEVARLYRLASDALNAMPGFEDLLDGQRKWLAERNTCFDQECLAEMYVRRVHQLRQSFSAARKVENASRSAGPFVLRCDGLNALVGVTVITTNPAYAHVEWRNSYVVMKKKAASGVQYEGNFAMLRAKGNVATLKLPSGDAELNCKLETGG